LFDSLKGKRRGVEGFEGEKYKDKWRKFSIFLKSILWRMIN